MTTQTLTMGQALDLSRLTLARMAAAVALDAARARARRALPLFRPSAHERAYYTASLAPYIEAAERAELAELAELMARPDVMYPEDVAPTLTRIAELTGTAARS